MVRILVPATVMLAASVLAVHLDHMAILEDPSGAEQSTRAIRDVVASVRNHTPLRTP